MVGGMTLELRIGSSENSGEAEALKLVEDHLKRGISNPKLRGLLVGISCPTRHANLPTAH